MTTRKGLVAKKWSFPRKNDDEKRSRRFERFSPQNGDEKESRRQKREFPAKNDDEKRSRRKKFPHTKLSARVSLIGKK
ncbi:hypothetical protein CEJ87_16815 [Caldifermentibacillus hisashii]|nr:hypothetical protein CEJ87_16815 [Caldifermentibacillus hisashii]